MRSLTTHIPGLLVIEPDVFQDDRGSFLETWQQHRYGELGISTDWVQDNLSSSKKKVLRGLHMQSPKAQAKLITVLKGEVYDVAVDLRYGSPTFGKWEAMLMNEKSKKQFYIPAGFAHGLLVTSDDAMFSYKCSDFYDPRAEVSILWNDPDLAIAWPFQDPILSPKDAQALRLKDIPMEKFVPYRP